MDSFQDRLLDWYNLNARTLPWRVSPQDHKAGIRPDPYHVWLSEVMLQQTTVAAVKGYFEKFINQWPTVEDLAAARDEDIMAAWAGLGYYSRARNLKACAGRIVSQYGGKFPQDQAELLKLPGVGDYTSAAIAAIAFGKPAAVVDGNIERVVTRQTANSTPLPKVKTDCRSFMTRHTPEDRPGDFVQAMMDLGATICTPKNPACSTCPVRQGCLAADCGTTSAYPVKPPRKKKPHRKGAAFVIENENGAILLIRRQDSGLLAGMTGLPTTQWTARHDGETGTNSLPFDSDWRNCGRIRHTFTHFHLELEVWHTLTNQALIDQNPAFAESWWSSTPEYGRHELGRHELGRHELGKQGLPTVMKKAVAAALPKTIF